MVEGESPFVDYTFEGFEYLQEGVNFYAQPPFDEILQGAADQSGLDLQYLRLYLTRLSSRTGRQVVLPPPLLQDESIIRLFDQKIGELLVKDNDEVKPDRVNVGATMRGIVGELARFPEWKPYVSSRLLVKNYKQNGDFISMEEKWRMKGMKGPRSVFVPEQSFMAHLAQVQRTERSMKRHARDWVISEAFPQQRQGMTTAEAVAAFGDNRAKKRWTLRLRPPR